jgi:hypothetical protein
MTGAEVAAPRVDIPTSPAMFGATIGAGEEALGQGFEKVGQAAAFIQNLHDEVTTNQAVTNNFKNVDMANGKFEQLPGDQQQAQLPAHIDAMRKMVDDDSANMTMNQKLMFQRQTLWNLRAQIARAQTSADASYHKFAMDSTSGVIENTAEHMIRNIDNDAIVHLDRQIISEKFATLSAMQGVPIERMKMNLRKTFDNLAGKAVKSILLDPKEDVNRAQMVLNEMSKAGTDGTPQMSVGQTQYLQSLIRQKSIDIESKQWGRNTSDTVAPLIGGNQGSGGIVVQPNTPTQPVEPIPPAAPTAVPKPEIRSEIDPATDALNRGDYLAFATETYRPHAPKVQLASLPGPMQGLPARGGPEVTSAIADASRAYGLDPGTMSAIASIESANSPGSNRNRATQYKGLFQIGKEEWKRYGEGDIYNPRDNAMAAARMLKDHQTWFLERFGRNPTDGELYMMHQQGRGFFTRGAMTNIVGNRYPGMRGPQSRAAFQQGWANELARRKMLLAGPETVGA